MEYGQDPIQHQEMREPYYVALDVDRITDRITAYREIK